VNGKGTVMRRLFGCIVVLVGLCVVGSGQAISGDDSVAPGQKLFTKYRCQSCHSIKALKIEKKKAEDEEEEEAAKETGTKKEPPDLSGVGLTRKADWIEGWLLKKELIDGKKHRKRFSGTAKEAKTIAAWLAIQKTKVDEEKKAAK